MPGSMPGHVAKGAILAKLEKALNDSSPNGKRSQFHQRIAARAGNQWKEDLLEVATEILPLDASEEDHLRNDWFDPHEGWWARQQPIDVVVRLGLIHAIELADGKAGGVGPKVRDLDFYWICGVPSFSITSCVSDALVTTLFITPGRPASDRLPGQYPHAERIFTTRHQSLSPGETLLGAPVEFVEFVQTHRS